MQDMSKPRATAEPNSACWMHQVSMKVKLYRRQDYATGTENTTYNVNVKVMATTIFKTSQQHSKCKNAATQTNIIITKQLPYVPKRNPVLPGVTANNIRSGCISEYGCHEVLLNKLREKYILQKKLDTQH